MADAAELTRLAQDGLAGLPDGTEWSARVALTAYGYALTVSANFGGPRRGYNTVVSERELLALGNEVIAARTAQLAQRLIRNAELRRQR